MKRNSLIKPLFFLFLCLFLSQGAFSQFKVKNKSNSPIWVAYAEYESSYSFKGWVSHGWYKLIPGETRTLISWLEFSGGNIYVHAHDADDGEWGRDVYLTTDKYNAFTIKNCDMDYHRGSNYRNRKFTKVATGDTKTFTFSFSE